MLSVNDLPFVAAIACGAARLVTYDPAPANFRNRRLLPRKDRVAMRPSTQNRIIHLSHITQVSEGVKNWLPGGPADETVCPTFPAGNGFADWVGQAVSPAGPSFHTAEQIVAAPKPESRATAWWPSGSCRVPHRGLHP